MTFTKYSSIGHLEWGRGVRRNDSFIPCELSEAQEANELIRSLGSVKGDAPKSECVIPNAEGSACHSTARRPG